MDWTYELIYHPIVGVGVCLVLALLTVALRRLTHRTRLSRHLDASYTLILLGLLFGAVDIAVHVAGWTAASPYINAVFFGTFAIGLVRATLRLFVDFYLRQREGAAISAIVQDVASVIAYFLVVLIVLRSTLDINLASLVATSAVLTVIVGLALQDVLGNLFSGLVLELEASFGRGDWVRVGAFEGKVVETRWRTTKIRTRVDELITLPNAMLSKEALVNYSRPDLEYADTLTFGAAYEAPPNVVKQAVLEVLATESLVLRTPRPEVRVDQYADSSVGYAIRYWITNFEELERIRDRIMTNIWYALRRAGVRIPFPARDVFVYSGTDASILKTEHPDVTGILRHVPILTPLDDAVLDQLAARAGRLTFGVGEIVVREGEHGDSFYVIERGTAEVTVAHDGTGQTVGRLHAGDFFGEMSLLAGERRTATVRATNDLTVLVIEHAMFRDIISANPAILEPLSEIAARRQASQDEHRRKRQSTPGTVDPHGAQRLRTRIKAFFRI